MNALTPIIIRLSWGMFGKTYGFTSLKKKSISAPRDMIKKLYIILTY